MDPLDVFAVSRRIWPRVTAAIILAALLFAPRPTGSLLERAAEIRTQRIVTMLEQALDSTLHTQADHPRRASHTPRHLTP
jgi:hypothetical protein